MEIEADATLRGQVQIWKHMLSFADSMALKCAVELQLPDIIHSHAAPITLSQIASTIPGASSPDLSCLARIMRLLVRRQIFTKHQPSDGGEALYGPTHSSRWLLSKTASNNGQLTLAPMVLMENHPWLMAPWHCFSRCVREGGIAFKKAHGGQSIWDYGAENPEFNKLFNDAMECTAKVVMRAILSDYRDGFADLKSLVDVGGGTGGSISEIVRSQPHIRGINFDLPHVVATAPAYPGVSHVGGDMFDCVPTADAIFMKWILHDWSDEDCVKILKNCRKAIAEESGKLIIVESVLEEGEGEAESNDLFGDTALVFDLVMVAHTTGGKERTHKQWKTILEEGGFPRYNITKIQALTSIIEAYPN
ncbi:xanthohumol 4-O-methyltransferase-like [Humulus lupulus]|uniref:xanthohumol 4-O-methyltransferase-like n=1 Tax=Humulus lupulus TaxID=3486 RepID=UPI002B408CD5|nr:xanthohumol 4-O-methyltransferase-like [Humulus lupulus]